jgi:DNA polymerase III alpha subunit
MTPDSAITIEAYAKRATELGHLSLSSVEHGWQGQYYDVYDMAKTYNLKFIFGTEAYWVQDRFENDRTNCHIILLAKNEAGRRAINTVLSDANIDGYYYRPRIDLALLLSLPPKDVLITTACVAFWQYADINETVKILHNHFKDNFYLEVQYHLTTLQKQLNKKIIDLSTHYKIPLIMGCDSHYIYPEQAQERDNVLEAKGVRYEHEDGWFMDYCDGQTCYQRFEQQKILNVQQISEAIKNTNIVLTFDDLKFSDDIKLPTLYPHLSQSEKDKLYKKIIVDNWKKFSTDIPLEQHQHYMEEIKKEVKTIINTKMADYFLIDYEIVKEALKNGGLITLTGRGSSVSYYTNTLLGFSKVDRISSPVKLYPERFISETRILQTKSLPDLDLNCGNPEIFADAQTKILGEGHSYPMISFGNFKIKSAFKLYAKSQKIPFEISNEITKQLEKYEQALKHTDEDSKDLIDMYDYVDEEFHEVLNNSKKYTNIIANKSIHPCGYLIYAGDIKSELGLIRIKNDTSDKNVIATVIDGNVAEKYKFLKNDLLKVDVVLIIYSIYKKIGIQPHSVNELLKITKDNQKVWDIYANGITMTINQCETEATTKKVMKYKPKNISELTAFIAAIRPSFKSMYATFESRQPFEYGISHFDRLIQTDEMPNSFVLYQEQMMATLNYAGFPTDECYGIIKAISKKKPKIVRPLKERFIKGFSEQLLQEENISDDDANVMSTMVWNIIADACGYSFNASHAYSYALDSLYAAYLKSHYPLEFYETILQIYAEKNKKDKVSKLKQELSHFNITMGELKFGCNNTNFIAEKNTNTINDNMLAIKYLSHSASQQLYELGQNFYCNFLDLLIDLNDKTVDKRQLVILTKLNYFSEFGNNQKLLHFITLFNELYYAKSVKQMKYQYDIPMNKIIDFNTLFSLLEQYSKKTDKTFKDIDNYKLLSALWDKLYNIKMPFPQQAKDELEYLGYIQSTEPKVPDNLYFVIDLKTFQNQYKPYLNLYKINNGDIIHTKIINDVFYQKRPFKQYAIIEILSETKEAKNVRVNGAWKKSKTDFDNILIDWNVCYNQNINAEEKVIK